MSDPAPIRLSINALGGQGGGVLADWLVATGDACGWLVQATSVPGVAQRTGATVYYLEFCPPDPAGRMPVQALMPVPGDVDVVVASELMEAGRAIARGLVTPNRTTLITSSHRIFAIAEKSAMGDGIASPAKILEACRTASRRLVIADYQALAERNGSVISAALFGALAGSGALPFPRSAFEDAIRAGGVGVNSSLQTFGAAFDRTAIPAELEEVKSASTREAKLSAVRDTIAHRLPELVWPMATLGTERLADYQDGAYAGLYLDRLAAVADAERQMSPDPDWNLTRETARYLALWMAYEDVIRVADLKTRGSRQARVLVEARARPEQIVEVSEYMHPRFEEFCETLPWRLGGRLLASDRARRVLAPLLERNRTITSSRLGGYLLLYGIAGLRRWRRGTLRFRTEQERITVWLASALNALRTDPDLSVEIIRCQRLVKGYGSTHARGLHNFATIMRQLTTLIDKPGAAEKVRALREAALKDDEGRALSLAVQELRSTTVPSSSMA